MQTTSCPSCGAPLPIVPAGTVQRCSFCNREIRAEAAAIHAGGAPERGRRAGLWALAGVGALVAIGIGVIAIARPRRTTEGLELVETSSPSIAAGLGSGTPPAALAPLSTSTATSADAATPSPELADGPATLTWTAKIASSSGAAPPRGAACTIVLTALAKGGEADQQRLTLQCAGKVLYDSDDPLSGMSEQSFDLEEEPVGGDVHAYIYELAVRDVGPREPPRAQISGDTSKHVFDAFRDVDSVYRVHLDVARDSAVRHGNPMLAENIPPFAEVVSRTASVTAESGAVPFATRSCHLTISPAKASGSTCRVLLECAGKSIYGAGTSGFDACAVRDGQPRGFSDPVPSPTDGDPILTVDLDAATATLGDTSKSGATYSVTFALVP